jgi:hypothetical protein
MASPSDSSLAKVPRPILEREPGCFETAPAAFPEYLG